MILHAGCVARFGPEGWGGVLLTGSSGVGKSDLMLRLMERGWRLVADDRTEVWPSGGRLYGKAPPPLARLIEVRGLDVLAVGRREFATIVLVVHCAASDVELDRIPEGREQVVAGVAVERAVVRPLEASAPGKVELALARAVVGRTRQAS